jgi:hypothetical protein
MWGSPISILISCLDEQPAPTDLVAGLLRPDARRSSMGEIEALLRSVGAEISEGAGSRVRVALGGVRAVFHRPHPGPETRRSVVRAVQDILAAAGINSERE